MSRLASIGHEPAPRGYRGVVVVNHEIIHRTPETSVVEYARARARAWAGRRGYETGRGAP